MASLALKITGQLWVFPQKPQDRLKGVLRSHGLKWPKFYLSPRLSQWKELSTAEEILFGTNTQHLIPWLTLEKDGRSEKLWYQKVPYVAQAIWTELQAFIKHMQTPSLLCIQETVHSGSSVCLAALTRLQKQCATTFNCLLPLLNLKHHLSHLFLRPSD